MCGVIQQTGPPERNSVRKCHISICRSRIAFSRALDCIFGLYGNIVMILFFQNIKKDLKLAEKIDFQRGRGVSVKKLLNLSIIIKIHQIYYRISYTSEAVGALWVRPTSILGKSKILKIPNLFFLYLNSVTWPLLYLAKEGAKRHFWEYFSFRFSNFTENTAYSSHK